jgi:hypothetical protein
LHESEYGGAQYGFSRMFFDFSSSSALDWIPKVQTSSCMKALLSMSQKCN